LIDYNIIAMIDPILGTLVVIYALSLRSKGVPDSRVCDFIKLIDDLSAFYYTLRYLPEDHLQSKVNPYPYHYFEITIPCLDGRWVKRGHSKFRNFSGEIREAPTSFSEIKEETRDFVEGLLQDEGYMNIFRKVNRIIEKNMIMGNISWGNIHIAAEKSLKKGIELVAEIPKEEVSDEIISGIFRPLDNISYGISSAIRSLMEYIKKRRPKYEVTRLPPQSQNDHLKIFMDEELRGKREKSIYEIVGLCTGICSEDNCYYLKMLLDYDYSRERIELPKKFLRSYYVPNDLENKILRLHALFIPSQRKGPYLRAIRVEVLREGKYFDWIKRLPDTNVKNLNKNNPESFIVTA